MGRSGSMGWQEPYLWFCYCPHPTVNFLGECARCHRVPEWLMGDGWRDKVAAYRESKT